MAITYSGNHVALEALIYNGTTTTVTNYNYMVVVNITENSYDTAANTSNVTFSATFYRTKTNGSTTAYFTGSTSNSRWNNNTNTILRIGLGNSNGYPSYDGEDDDNFYTVINTSSANYNFAEKSGYTVCYGTTFTSTVDIPHNADGSCTLKWNVFMWRDAGTKSTGAVLFDAVGTLELTDIPRVMISNGSKWLSGTVYISSGTEWKHGTVKISNGSGWVPEDSAV